MNWKLLAHSLTVILQKMFFYSSDMLLEEDIERQSTCELEVDVVAADILNRLEVGGKITATCYYIP